MNDKPLLEARGLQVSYGSTPALRGASLTVEGGDIIALTGRSGSGKSSLLYCLAGIVLPQRGQVLFEGLTVSTLDDDARTRVRREHFGFVFQFGELVPELTLSENVSLPLRLNGVKGKDSRNRTNQLLDRFGIAELGDRRPGEVSGGQLQRAAIARSLVHQPKVVLADEPTGALDEENGRLVMREFLDAARQNNTAVVVVTHETSVADVCDTRLEVVDGTVVGSAPSLKSDR